MRASNVNQRDNPTRCVFQKKFSYEKKSTNFDLIEISMKRLWLTVSLLREG